MKKILWIILLLGCFGTSHAQNRVVYTCVMHPQIKMDKPGNCPICGMVLVKKTLKKPAVKQAPAEAPPQHQPPQNHGMEKEMKQDSLTRREREAASGKTAAPESLSEPHDKVDFRPGKTVRYDLYVTDTMVNYTGRTRHAIAINGAIPGPELVFTEGDTAEIYLHNGLKKEETSLHWHGVILPNRFDGVPYLTSARIGPGETHLYKFKVVQNGTVWYHSHSGLQEQMGMYGALIFKKRKAVSPPEASPSFSAEKEYTVVLSEWTDEEPMQVQRRLRTGNDWYAIRKGSTQSYAEAIRAGHFSTKLTNEWKRMKAMDVSDVYYDRFLVNGRSEGLIPSLKAGDTLKLRVVNGGSSTYFWLGFAGGNITVLGNDGNDVVPVAVDRLLIAPAETFDLQLTLPAEGSYEFRATPEDRSGHASLWMGTGRKFAAPVLPRLKYFEGMKMMNAMMRVNGTMKDMGMSMHNQSMDMNAVMYPELEENEEQGGRQKNTEQGMEMEGMQGKDSTGNGGGHERGNMASMDRSSSTAPVTLNYDMLRAPLRTALPDGPFTVLHFELTGNMNRYVWTIDNKTVNEADRILIRKGDKVRLILSNQSMMRHPMHLHGHDFRVVNAQGPYAPLKNVIDVMPMETDTIELAANQSGDWFFHCHILFHMMAGMGRVFSYENSPANPELPHPREAYRQFKMANAMTHFMVRAGLESNGSDGEAMLSATRYALLGMWHLGYMPSHGYEGELNLGRYLGRNQWWFPYIGFDYHYKKEEGDPLKRPDYKTLFGQVSDKNDRKTIVAGVQYTLPWLLVADGRVDGKGKFRFQLSREDIPVSSRLRFNFMGNTDREYTFGLRYIVSKWFALSTHYDSDMGAGAGITITY
ncbi:MAG: multicopper oxidase domain-containing protein [Flavisolibacter sp.]